MLFDGQTMNVFVAFLAGTITFLAPCVLPILPAYIGYISGISLEATTSKSDRRKVFLSSLAFVGGFLVIFVLLGITATWIGRWLNQYRILIQTFGGVLMVLIGLHIAGVFRLKIFSRYAKINVQKEMTRFQYLNAFIIGAVFGFSWTPCIGPVLGVILFWAGHSDTFWQGFFLLLSFGLGLGIPFLFLSLFASRMTRLIRGAGVWLERIQIMAGIIIIIMGILLIGDWLAILVRPLMSLGSLEIWLLNR
jgi:cytochrome c-type biogenesis protein